MFSYGLSDAARRVNARRGVGILVRDFCLCYNPLITLLSLFFCLKIAVTMRLSIKNIATQVLGPPGVGKTAIASLA